MKLRKVLSISGVLLMLLSAGSLSIAAQEVTSSPENVSYREVMRLSGETEENGEGFAFLQVRWSPDGSKLAAIQNDTQAYIWNVTTGDVLFTLDTLDTNSIDWNSDGTRLASLTRSSEVKIWDGETGILLQTLSALERQNLRRPLLISIDWSPDGRWIAAWGGVYWVWNVATGDLPQELQSEPFLFPTGAAWHPDSQQLATIGYSGDVSLDPPHTVRVWQMDSQISSEQTSFTIRGYSPVVWSPDQARLVTNGIYRTMNVWNASSGENLAVLTGHANQITAIDWGVNDLIASADQDGWLHLWSGSSLEELLNFQAHTDFVSWIAWSPNGTHLASASFDGTVAIWSVE